MVKHVVLDQARNHTKATIQSLLQDTVNHELDRRLTGTPQPSCSCGGPGKWTRMAYLNMSDTSQQCPSSLNFTATPVRGCDRLLGSCDSIIFPSNSQSYSHVCGRIVGFQRGTTNAFNGDSFEGPYLDGVSVTHGGSRQHIWSFVAALHDANSSYITGTVCPCSNANQNWPHSVPSFINNNYFCDSGNHESSIPTRTFAREPIWDGTGCSTTSTCCDFHGFAQHCRRQQPIILKLGIVV